MWSMDPGALPCVILVVRRAYTGVIVSLLGSANGVILFFSCLRAFQGLVWRVARAEGHGGLEDWEGRKSW